MRRITTFVVLIQVMGTSLIKFSLCIQAVYNNKDLAYWKLDLQCPQIINNMFFKWTPPRTFCLSLYGPLGIYTNTVNDDIRKYIYPTLTSPLLKL